MSDSGRSREELSRELSALRARVAELERDAAEDALGGRTRMDVALRESEERLRTLIDATGDDVVVLLDAEHRAVVVNQRAAASFGLPVSEVLGRTILDLAPGEVAGERHQRAQEVLEQGAPQRFEDQRAGRWYDNNMCPVLGPDGRPQGVAIFARDITRRKAMERALAQAKEEADKASVAKSRFLAAASHDLRQPLQAMSLLLGALTFPPMEGQAREIARDMQSTLAVMEGLLNALLDITKLEAGIVIPRERDFSALVFLHRLQGQFRPLAADRGVRVRVFPNKAGVRTDPDLLERILHNLMSNAIRHTRKGRVLLGSRRRGDRLRIEVWDTGEGIAEDQLESIFDEFYQLGNPARNRHQGLGLGLAIAKRVADLLGLRLGAFSRVGKGSVFFVEVPLASSPVAQAGVDVFSESPEEALNLCVLVVEDDEPVLLATARLLRSWGFHAFCAASAAEALSLIREQGLRPDVAVVDYRLPDGANGIELLAAIDASAGRRLPAVLVTGDTAGERQREAQACGYPLLHKPVAPGELRRTLVNQYLSGFGSGAPEPNPVSS